MENLFFIVMLLCDTDDPFEWSFTDLKEAIEFREALADGGRNSTRIEVRY